MTRDEDESAKLDARDQRRWLIGVGISLVFGLFGMVMALLSHFPRAKAAPTGVAPAAPRNGVAEPVKRGDLRRDHRR